MRHVLYVCRAENCRNAGCESLIAHIEHRLGSRIGSTTADGEMRLLSIYCLGNCNHGPAILLDDHPYGPVTPELADGLIGALQ